MPKCRFIALVAFASLMQAAAQTPNEIALTFGRSLAVVKNAETAHHFEVTATTFKINEHAQAQFQRMFKGASLVGIEMRDVHWKAEPVRALVIVGAKTNRVVAYLWDPTFERPSIKARRFFGGAVDDGIEPSSVLDLLNSLMTDCFAFRKADAGTDTSKVRLIHTVTSEGLTLAIESDQDGLKSSYLTVEYMPQQPAKP